MAPADKIRVLIVDDSVVVRVLLSDWIKRDPTLELAGAEANGRAALNKLAVLRPDVVVLDVEMPEMGGVETAAAIRAQDPRLPVIMFSAHTEEGAAITIEALSRGAADYVTKPVNAENSATAIGSVREQLLTKIKILGQTRRRRIAAGTEPSSARSTTSSILVPRRNVDIVCMAASTGGPNALEIVLSSFPADFPVPILIVQHMPPVFTRHLAQRLAGKCAVRVREAESGEALGPGIGLIAPGDFHLKVRCRGVRGFAETDRDPPENSCRPSADVLLRSAAEAFGTHTLAVVLTGMGQDGLKGCEAIRGASGQVLVQDEATSVVWGMPGAIARAGLAHKVLPIEKLTAEIIRRVQTGRS